MLSYSKHRNLVENVNFPLFLMGNTLQSLLYNQVKHNQVGGLKSMKHLQHTNLSLRALKQPNDTYILDELTDSTMEQVILEGTFFNRQKLGLTLKDFSRMKQLN